MSLLFVGTSASAPANTRTLSLKDGSHQDDGLILRQIQECGFFYSVRKYLLIAFRFELPAHLAVTRSLALPQTCALTKRYPLQPFKYLHNFLALSFSTHSRAIILSNHYRFLGKVVANDFIGRICQGSISLWEETVEGRRYAIDLTYPKNEEGELFLVFTEDSSRLFTLSFTIAPGDLLKVEDNQVVFIGRLQGVANKRDAVKQAGKSFHDVSPQALLLAAVRGIAAAFKISGIVGVSAQNQVCKDRTPSPESSKAAYDEFYISAGGTALGEEFFYLSATPNEKPLSEIKNNHRSRVKRKREIKNVLIEEVSSAFQNKCLSSRVYGDRP
jgi:uncharacterized protein VirK/YbjX